MAGELEKGGEIYGTHEQIARSGRRTGPESV